MSARLLQSNFAAGEVSQRIIASGDLERFGAALQRAYNAVILPLGAAQRRAGSIWVENPGVNAPGRLLPFVRMQGDAVAIVVQATTLRFIDVATRAYVEAEGAPVEVETTWTADDLEHKFSWQSADVVWIGDRRGTSAIAVLKRVAGAWQALAELELRNGPFLADSPGQLTVSSPAVGAGRTLGFPAGTLTAAHVGSLIGVRENTGSPPVRRWLSEEDTSDPFVFNAGRVYSTVGSGPNGNNSPIHEEGSVSDGVKTWQFVHDGLGVIRITGFTSDVAGQGEVIAHLPSVFYGSVDYGYWGFGSYSNAVGWPRAGCVHHERMVLGGGDAQPDTTHMSRVEGYGPDFADFKAGLGTGLVVDSDAVRRALNSGTVQQVLHYVSFERLYAFTSEGVHVIGGPSLDEPITPAGASARARTTFGAAPEVAPVKTGDSIFYVTSGREELREIVRDNLDTPNATVLADHIGGRGFAEIAFAQSPLPIVWARLDDGFLASMTYERLERVRAWAQHELGGAAKVISAIVLPDASGRSEVWLYVERQVDGAAFYSIEIIPPAWNGYREPIETACYLDAAGFFDFWNTDADNRARLTVLDFDARAGEVETELDTFSAGDVGKRLALRLGEPAPGWDPGDDAKIARIDVQEYVSAKIVRGKIVTDGADGLDGAWTAHWARMESVLDIGPRLEGLAVEALADGSALADLVVDGGEVTLPEPVARGWVGLRARFELIDLPVAQGSPLGTAFGVPKKIERLWIVAQEAPAGLKVFNPETGVETDLIWRSADDPTERPAAPVTGYISLLPPGAWSSSGQIGVRLDAPYPVTVLGIIKEVATQ